MSLPPPNTFGALRSPLGRARGLGSAKSGTHHWMAQRVTALANIPLVVWGLLSILSMVGQGIDYSSLTTWLAQPIHAALMILFVISTFYHAALGLQIVIEDYIHHKLTSVLSLIAVKLVFFAAGTVCVLSVLSIAL